MPNTHQTSSITNLTLSECDSIDFSYLLTQAPMLKYLHIKELEYRWLYHIEKPFGGKIHPHLKELVVDNVHSTLNELEFFVKQISNLQRLTISASNNKDMIDADHWERLKTSLLPQLDSFKFVFRCRLDKETGYILCSNNFRLIFGKNSISGLLK